jgi:ABC-2 type transport system ATP-binding protein
MSADRLAVAVRDLRKTYQGAAAIRGITFEVAPGEVFALLGPNGAGKTTTIEILEGYRARTGGDAEVLGVDPGRPTQSWRERIGLVLQECELDPNLTVRETVTLFASFYPHPRPIDETIELVGLRAKRDALTGTLSGGERRRADVAVGIVGDPELLFLDEPTTGFDPSARRDAWSMISALRDLGTTILLTTHYMEEAQALADRVAILRAGELVAAGTIDEIGHRPRRAGDRPLPAPGGRHGERHRLGDAVARRGGWRRGDDPYRGSSARGPPAHVLGGARGTAARGARGGAAAARGHVPGVDGGPGVVRRGEFAARGGGPPWLSSAWSPSRPASS